MRSPSAVLFGGLVLSILGTATATDAVSLRDVFHAVPVLGGLVIELRLSIGTSLAHALEPATGVVGFGLMLLAVMTPPARAIRSLIPARA